ncbi:MAG: hypothetical protein LBT95_02465 [Treponema sp.]|nr:hypothetical protein [Treponema sp.]
MSANNPEIVFVNKTPWQVHIVAGSGRTDVCDIAPMGRFTVKNLWAVGEVCYPVFDVSLTETFSLKNLRPADRDFYIPVGGSLKEQRIEINIPAGFNDTAAYILMTNGAKSGGIFLSRNDSQNLMTSIDSAEGKTTVNSGETLVYRINSTDITKVKALTIRPGNISGSVDFRQGYVYQVLFDGSSLSVEDARPLTRMGEKGWVRNVAGADTTIQVVGNTGGHIGVFSSHINAGLESCYFQSGGEFSEAATRRLANFSITGAVGSGDNTVIVLGYLDKGSLGFMPVLQRQYESGGLIADLAPSRRRDIPSAYFLAAAEEDGVLLAVGGADSGVNNAGDYKAYIRAVREDTAAFTPLWEIGPDAFDAAAGGRGKCGATVSVIFDKTRDRWLAAGQTIEYDNMRNPVPGSYIAEINREGDIVRIDFSLRGFLVNKITRDGQGALYLAGEEAGSGENYALMIKLDGDGKTVWRTRNRPLANSFYQDVLFDEEGRQLVLAGTLGAWDSNGTGGMPFIEGVDAESGEFVWRETFGGRNFYGTALVTGIAKAPFYGLVLALSGIADGNFVPPFMTARVNSRGKL